MSTLRLLNVLKKVKNPGSFAAGGAVTLLGNTQLKIEGIPEPIHPFQLTLNHGQQKAKAIIEKCSRAPYGRGEETIVDTNVRKTWQLDPSQFTIVDYKAWEATLDALVKEVCVDLGCAASQDITCELYKFLLYEPGGFFKPHRDTEKVDGMFGTLVIQLPSDYKRGQLVVHHQGEKKTFDFSRECELCTELCYFSNSCPKKRSASNTYYAAFYADCQHEIREVTEGYRLCLIYNLVSRTPQTLPLAIPAAEDNSETVDEVVKIISEWTADEKASSVMAYLLDHKYCGSGLSFNLLKNRDRAVAEVLLNARNEVNFDLYLTMLSKKEIYYGEASSAHPCGYCAGYCGDHKSIGLAASWIEAGGVIVTPCGTRKSWCKNLDLEELNKQMQTEDVKADEEEFNEATGNDGATVDKIYHRAALLVRPYSLAVHGLDGMIERLEEAIDDVPKDSMKWKQWEEMINKIIFKEKDLSQKAIVSILHYLCIFHNAELANTFLMRISAFRSSISHLQHCSDEVLKACNVLGWSALKSGLCQVFESGSIDDCSELLLKLIGDDKAVLTPEQHQVCCQLADIVYNNILQQTDKELDSRHSIYLIFKILSLLHCDKHLKSLLEFFLKKNRSLLVSVLIPVVQELHQQGLDKDGILLSCCIKALDDQLSSSSVPCEPADWSRDITLKCTCNDCRKLQEFLVHPFQTQFEIDDTARHHLEKELRTSCPQFNDFSDQKYTTWVLTKTHHSFETKLQEYQANLKTLADLRQLSHSGEEPSAKHPKLDL